MQAKPLPGLSGYLTTQLPAAKFAEIDSEAFYDFTTNRSETFIADDGVRHIRWPITDFHFHEAEGDFQNLILFRGTEPNLR